MKKLIFISTGRCGTTRISEILKDKLPNHKYAVVHQMKFSRLANVLGNIMYYWNDSNRMKKYLYTWIISKYQKGNLFISTDPLTSMIIPKEFIESSEVCLVHIVRDPDSFAKSMYSFSRCRLKSLIAHNIMPLWQPGIWPFENIVNKNILNKYREVANIKNEYFFAHYSRSMNYHQVKMSDLFLTNLLQEIVNKWFDESISITASDLNTKSNESG